MAVFFRFLLGSLIGSALGTLIGLLVAPRAGRETRSIIKDEFDQRYQGSALQSRLQGAQEKVATTLHDTQEKVQKSLHDTRETLQKTAQDTAENLKVKAQQVSEELEQTGKNYINAFQNKSNH
jgi:gas vesicle protein